MKYGIVTFQNVPNPGAALQAYALCKYIRDYGYDCEIINYQCKALIERERTYIKQNNIVSTIRYYFFNWCSKKKRISGHDSFMMSSNMLSNDVYYRSNINKANDVYDGFITGSDQVWNSAITKGDNTYFLDFAEQSKKRLAFSASSGGFIERSPDPNLAETFCKYDAIGVREESLRKVLLEKFSVGSTTVADPTMLLDVQDYLSLLVEPKEKNYVFVYYPSEEILNFAKQYAAKKNKEVLVVAAGRPTSQYRKVSFTNPEEWLGYIYYADAVFTNSYHGLLFSLYFNKKVWTNYSGEKSARQISVINRLDIPECIIYDTNFDNYQINYQKCNKKMIDFRNESRSFLNNLLDREN